MILLTKRDPGRRHQRVNEPITHTSRGYNAEIGHYLEVYFQGSDKTAYTLRFTAADIDKLDQLWEAGAAERAALDAELSDGP